MHIDVHVLEYVHVQSQTHCGVISENLALCILVVFLTVKGKMIMIMVLQMLSCKPSQYYEYGYIIVHVGAPKPG